MPRDPKGEKRPGDVIGAAPHGGSWGRNLLLLEKCREGKETGTILIWVCNPPSPLTSA
jgi:hypothetical protein